MDRNEEELVVGGYRFGTVADAETARMEQKKVVSVEQHLDYHNPQNVLLAYLHRMQTQLAKCGVPQEKIRPIPLYATFSNKTANNSSIRRSLEARLPGNEYKGRFVTSVVVNILLAVALAVLVLLSLQSEVPTIVNYRTAVVNEYSEWEQELHEREQAVREAEQKLNITPE